MRYCHGDRQKPFPAPDAITLATVWVGLLTNSIAIFTSAPNAIWGASFGYLIIWGINKIYRLSCGEDGIGLGDAKWLAIPGAWFGIESAIYTLLVATLLTGVYVLTSGHRKMPFGPALSAATVMTGLIALSR